MVNSKIGIRFGNFAVLVLVPYRNSMTLLRFYPGSIPPRFILSCCELLLLPLLAELVRYYLCIFSKMYLCEIACFLRPPFIALTVLASVTCVRCLEKFFGT